MRTLHLIESAHTGHVTNARHAAFAVIAHGALALGAIYATTQAARTPVDQAPDQRVYFAPEPRPAAPAQTAPRPRAVTRSAKPAAVSQPKATAAPAAVPSVMPPVDARLADPSVSAAPVSVDPPAGEVPAGAPAGPVGNEPFDINQVEVPAAALPGAKPAYPERAISFGLSGKVSARFIVGKNGRVESDVVILSSTSGDFALAVRNYLRRARYSPARVGGEPVRQLVEQEFVFQLGQ